MRYLVLVILASSLMSGCALWPTKKEFFQKEVPVYPQQSFKDLEALRQAASRAKETAAETFTAAIAEGSSPEVTEPAKETTTLVDAVSASVGPPLREPRDSVTSEKLAEALLRQEARYHRELDLLRERLIPLSGKDIEGTGRVQVGYFTLLIGAAMVGFLVIVVLRTIVSVVAQANPGVAVGSAVAGSVVKMGGRLVSNGFRQLMIGGEKFKREVKNTFEPEIAEQIKRLFQIAHAEAQDEEVKVAVKAATGAME
jgi:hypothetical protein